MTTYPYLEKGHFLLLLTLLALFLGRAEGQSTFPSFQRHCNAGYYVSGSAKNWGQAYIDDGYCTNWAHAYGYQTGFGSHPLDFLGVSEKLCMFLQ